MLQLFNLFSNIFSKLDPNTEAEDWDKDRDTPQKVIRLVIIFAMAILLYSILIFNILPFCPWHTRNSVFWMSYIFTLIAIPFQAVSYYIVFHRSKTPMNKFYAFPQVRVGIKYMGIQFLVSLGLMIISSKVDWTLAFTIQAFIIGFAVILFVANDMTRATIEQQEKNLDKDAASMLDIKHIAATLPRMTEDPTLKEHLSQLAESFRYSDPVSTKKTAEDEKVLFSCMQDLDYALRYHNISDEAILEMCDNIQFLLEQRNHTCLHSK